MHQVMTRADPSIACLPAPRTPSTRARSRATDGFSAMTSCTAVPAYRLSGRRPPEVPRAPPPPRMSATPRYFVTPRHDCREPGRLPRSQAPSLLSMGRDDARLDLCALCPSTCDGVSPISASARPICPTSVRRSSSSLRGSGRLSRRSIGRTFGCARFVAGWLPPTGAGLATVSRCSGATPRRGPTLGPNLDEDREVGGKLTLLRRALNHLDDESRDLLALHDGGEMPLSELARLVEHDRKTVRTRLTRARRRVSRWLGAAGDPDTGLPPGSPLRTTPPQSPFMRDKAARGRAIGSAARELEILRVSPELCSGALGNVTISDWRGPQITPAVIDTVVRRAPYTVQTCGGEIVYLALIESSMRPPPLEARNKIVDALEIVGPYFSTFAVVLLAPNAHIYQPILEGLMLQARPRFPVRFVTSIMAAAQWLCATTARGTGGPLTATALAAAAERVRRLDAGRPDDRRRPRSPRRRIAVKRTSPARLGGARRSIVSGDRAGAGAGPARPASRPVAPPQRPARARRRRRRSRSPCSTAGVCTPRCMRRPARCWGRRRTPRPCRRRRRRTPPRGRSTGMRPACCRCCSCRRRTSHPDP